MWLEVPTESHIKAGRLPHDHMDMLINHFDKTIQLRIYFGRVELATENEGFTENVLPLVELTELEIDELTLEFEVLDSSRLDGSGKEPAPATVFYLTVLPDNENTLVAVSEEISWLHFRIRNWYLTPG